MAPNQFYDAPLVHWFNIKYHFTLSMSGMYIYLPFKGFYSCCPDIFGLVTLTIIGANAFTSDVVILSL